MPIRQHLALLSDIIFFQLNSDEQQALKDFNLAFEQCIQSLVTQTQANMTRLKPLFQASVNPQNTVSKIRASILMKSLSTIKLDLPASVHALCEHTPYPYGLIRLAFHPDGEFFFQYLNDIINSETQKRLDPQKIFDRLEDLYRYNNTLSSEAFLAQITTPTKTHPFYPAIEKIVESRGWQAAMLLCNDGLTLDRLAAAFMYSHLIKTRRIDINKPDQLLTTNIKAQLNCAAIHGSFGAAKALIQRLKDTMTTYSSLTQLEEHYNQFYRDYFLPYLVPCFKTVAYLLLIEIQQTQFTKTTEPHDENFDRDTLSLRQNQHIIALYRTLHLAKKAEQSSKNILRLCFDSGTVAGRMQQLFPIPGVQLQDINEALVILKNQFSYLAEDFNKVSQETDQHLAPTIKP